jgi:hypothetical protein
MPGTSRTKTAIPPSTLLGLMAPGRGGRRTPLFWESHDDYVLFPGVGRAVDGSWPGNPAHTVR